MGASTLWSEAQSIQTLDNLLAAQLIDPVQYLERLPKGIIPDLTGLINSKRRDMEQQQAMQEAAMQQAMQQQAMAQGAEHPAAPTVEEIIGQLSPEEQEAFNNLPREEQERMLQEVMMA